MSLQIVERIIPTGDGVRHKQTRFYCPLHDCWFDLFVFPNAAERHSRCVPANETPADQKFSEAEK